MKRKMYVYGVAGLAAAAVGASAAGGLFSGSDEGEQAQGSTALAGQAGAPAAPPIKAPQVAPPKVAAPVVPVVPVVPAAKPAPVIKVAKVEPKTVKRDYKPVVQRKANPVRKATTSAPSSDPASGASLATPPTQVKLTFGGPVTLPADPIQVTGPENASWTVGKPEIAVAVVLAGLAVALRLTRRK